MSLTKEQIHEAAAALVRAGIPSVDAKNAIHKVISVNTFPLTIEDLHIKLAVNQKNRKLYQKLIKRKQSKYKLFS